MLSLSQQLGCVRALRATRRSLRRKVQRRAPAQMTTRAALSNPSAAHTRRRRRRRRRGAARGSAHTHPFRLSPQCLDRRRSSGAPPLIMPPLARPDVGPFALCTRTRSGARGWMAGLLYVGRIRHRTRARACPVQRRVALLVRMVVGQVGSRLDQCLQPATWRRAGTHVRGAEGGVRMRARQQRGGGARCGRAREGRDGFGQHGGRHLHNVHAAVVCCDVQRGQPAPASAPVSGTSARAARVKHKRARHALLVSF